MRRKRIRAVLCVPIGKGLGVYTWRLGRRGNMDTVRFAAFLVLAIPTLIFLQGLALRMTAGWVGSDVGWGRALAASVVGDLARSAVTFGLDQLSEPVHGAVVFLIIYVVEGFIVALVARVPFPLSMIVALLTSILSSILLFGLVMLIGVVVVGTMIVS